MAKFRIFTKNLKSCKGGVALEYILVTSFAAVATTIVLSVLTAIAHKKVSSLAEKFQVDADLSELKLF